jgi:target of rapamycin complex subunit LST8
MLVPGQHLSAPLRCVQTFLGAHTGSEDRTVKIWDVRARKHQRDFESRAPVNTVALHPHQNELISGDQDGNIRVWDLTANACSCELVPEVNVPVRSVSIAVDGSQVRDRSGWHGNRSGWRSVCQL